jgi:hypothetical protein
MSEPVVNRSGKRLSRFEESAHTGAVPDDDDRPRDASSAAGADWSDADQGDVSWADAVAPDDISELSKDIHAYHRECRVARRRQHLARLGLRHGSAALSVAIVALVVAAISATVFTMVRPDPRPVGPSRLPLARPSAAAGQLGGLLPPVSLTSSEGGATSSLNLRPGVLAVLPPHCNCGDEVADLAAIATTNKVGLYAIAPTALDQDADAAALVGLGPNDDVLYDPHRTLSTAIGADGLTSVVVDRDGTIVDIERNVGPANGVGASLTRMLKPESAG